MSYGLYTSLLKYVNIVKICECSQSIQDTLLIQVYTKFETRIMLMNKYFPLNYFKK